MLKSEKCWTLKIFIKNIVSEGINPERKCLSSIFTIADERAIFESNELMNPFNFDKFRVTLVNTNSDEVKIGVAIMYLIFIQLNYCFSCSLSAKPK